MKKTYNPMSPMPAPSRRMPNNATGQINPGALMTQNAPLELDAETERKRRNLAAAKMTPGQSRI